MNYDNYKLATPDYFEDISNCCGSEYTETNEDYICNSCSDSCDVVTEYDYNEYKLDDLADLLINEK